MDDLWWDNVGPLIAALETLGEDPVEWASDHDFAVFYAHDQHGMTRNLKRELDGYEPDMFHFACGYLQATGNLLCLTWAEQIAEQLAKRDAT